MCTNGINASQYKMMLEHMDDQVALNRRWVHKMYHSADESGLGETAATLKEIQGLLDEVRALLTDTQDVFDKENESSSGVTVSLV